MSVDPKKVRRIMSTGEMAELYSISKPAFLNMKSKNKDTFPKCFQKLQSVPIWTGEDILEYGKETGRFSETDVVAPADYNGVRRICILGGNGIGKSFVASLFTESPIKYRALFNRNNRQMCNIRLTVADTIESFDYIEFVTNFHKAFKNDAMYAKLCDIMEELNETRISLFNKEKVGKYLKKLDGLLHLIADAENLTAKKCFKCINILTRPGRMGKDIIRGQSGISKLEIIDTVGLNADMDIIDLPDADTYVYVLNDEDDVEEICRAIDKIKAYAATDDIIYMYRGYQKTENDAEYGEALNDAGEYFKKLGAEIGRKIRMPNAVKLPVLSVTDNDFLYVPYMNAREIDKSELLLSEKIKQRFMGSECRFEKINGITNDVKHISDTDFDKYVTDALKYADDNFNKNIKGGDYTIETFKAERHGLTAKCDNYALAAAVKSAAARGLYMLYDFVSAQKEADACFAADFYSLAVRAIKKDRGFFVNIDPGAYYPDKTLNVVIALLLEEIFLKIKNDSFSVRFRELNDKAQTSQNNEDEFALIAKEEGSLSEELNIEVRNILINCGFDRERVNDIYFYAMNGAQYTQSHNAVAALALAYLGRDTAMERFGNLEEMIKADYIWMLLKLCRSSVGREYIAAMK